ncbi:MAG: hypothetical protein AAB795_02930 [Patescibacteria group bacterium]
MSNSFLKDSQAGQERKVLPADDYLKYLQTLSTGENDREIEQTISFIQKMRKEMENVAGEENEKVHGPLFV